MSILSCVALGGWRLNMCATVDQTKHSMTTIHICKEKKGWGGGG